MRKIITRTKNVKIKITKSTADETHTAPAWKLIYEGRSINKLQTASFLLVFQI